MMHKREHVDDVALLAITCAANEEAIKTCVTMAGLFGLTVSLQKIKFMTIGDHGVTEKTRYQFLVMMEDRVC